MRGGFLAGILVMVLIFAGSVYAKEDGQTFYDVVNRMKTELHLTATQVDAIKPILKENILKYHKFADSLEGQPSVDKKNFKMMMRKLKEEMNEKLSKVLSKEQMQKLIEKQNQRESLNKDKIDYSEGLTAETSFNPVSGASMAF